jgi:hypothetical protein
MFMSARKVILYFDDQTDALRFALAAGSVMAGEQQGQASDDLIQEMQRASRVRIDEAVNREKPLLVSAALAAS